MIAAALEGKLDASAYEVLDYFGLSVPKTCPGVASELLNPKNTWKDKDAYTRQAGQLVSLFTNNFKQYQEGVSKEILDASPVF